MFFKKETKEGNSSPSCDGHFKVEIHPDFLDVIKSAFPKWDGDPKNINFLTPFSDFVRTSIALSFSDDPKPEDVRVIEVPSIRALFRGDGQCGEIKGHEDEYTTFFWNIERDLPMLAEQFRDRCFFTDDAFIEIYSAMRRRPDGKSIGFLHDIIWQRAAYFLLTHVCSQSEYEVCIHRLERSARTFHMNPMSENYLKCVSGDRDFDYSR